MPTILNDRPLHEGNLSNEAIHIVVLWNEDRSCRLFAPEFPAIGFIEGRTREEATGRLFEQIETLMERGARPAEWTLGTYAIVKIAP